MCLGWFISERAKKRYLSRNTRNGFIKVWKVVRDTGNLRYTPEFSFHGKYSYKGGLNYARYDACNEDELIHAFRSIESVERWQRGASEDEVIIQCMVKPEWIAEMGRGGKIMTLTIETIIMPKYPRRAVTYKEAKEAIKGKRVRSVYLKRRRQYVDKKTF